MIGHSVDVVKIAYLITYPLERPSLGKTPRVKRMKPLRSFFGPRFQRFQPGLQA